VGEVYILTPGGQYNHLIFRRVSELGYSAAMRPLEVGRGAIADASAIIIGGGPGRLGLGDGASTLLKEVLLESGTPVLGICYGHQLLAQLFDGLVAPSAKPEFGPAKVRVVVRDELFEDVPDNFTAWLSHNDEVVKLPQDFLVLAESKECAYQAIKHKTKPIYGVQFHVEVEHTQYGREILSNFLRLAKH